MVQDESEKIHNEIIQEQLTELFKKVENIENKNIYLKHKNNSKKLGYRKKTIIDGMLQLIRKIQPVVLFVVFISLSIFFLHELGWQFYISLKEVVNYIRRVVDYV